MCKKSLKMWKKWAKNDKIAKKKNQYIFLEDVANVPPGALFGLG